MIASEAFNFKGTYLFCCNVASLFQMRLTIVPTLEMVDRAEQRGWGWLLLVQLPGQDIQIYTSSARARGSDPQ